MVTVSFEVDEPGLELSLEVFLSLAELPGALESEESISDVSPPSGGVTGLLSLSEQPMKSATAPITTHANSLFISPNILYIRGG